MVPDRAAFDREYGGVALVGEREVLSQIPEDRVCDFPVKPRAGNVTGVTSKIPSGLCRQIAGGTTTTTAAALEEVSKCVREMHSFTNELLNWDLVERNGGTGGAGGDVTGAGGDITGDAGGNGTAEADSSGDSDDTVIEDPPLEEPLLEEPSGVVPRHGDTGVTASPPLPQTSPRAAVTVPRDWEEERLTLRALRELGEPLRDPPKFSGDPVETLAGSQLLPRLTGKTTPQTAWFYPKETPPPARTPRK